MYLWLPPSYSRRCVHATRKQCNKSNTKSLIPAFSDPSSICGCFRSLLRMGSLPDELWTKILGMGIEKGVLDYRDLCSLAFVCRRISRISSLECIWRPLWQRDQAELGGSSVKEKEIKSFRDLYRIRLISFLSDAIWLCEVLQSGFLHASFLLPIFTENEIFSFAASHFRNDLNMFTTFSP